MTARGLLLTITEPPPAMDEEFDAWYDDEHLPWTRRVTALSGGRERIARPFRAYRRQA